MTHLKNIPYILFILSLLLGYSPIADSREVSPVTYRAEFIPFGKGLNLKAAFPSEGGAFSLEFELVLSPGTVTAEVGAEILFDKDTETLRLHGTNGHLSSDGGIMLKGDIAMDFMVPLPEAFFEEDDSFHFAHKVPIPGFRQIEKGWNESEEFDSLLLNGSRPERVKLDIRIPQLVTIHLSAVEIIPVLTSALLSGGTLTTAVKIFVDNLSDYLDVGISLNGGIASELTLAGKAITVNGAPVTHENRLVRAPNSDSTEGTYQMQSNFDEEFTYAFDFVGSSNAYAKVSVLGGIEIWSYNEPFAEKRISIIPKDTFDLNFGGAATSANIDIPTEPPHEWAGPGVISDPVLASAVRSALNIWPNAPITPNAMLKLTKLWARGGIKDLTGLEHAVNLKELSLTGNTLSDVSSLSGLKNLESLDLSKNSLSEVSLSDMPNLKKLELHSNPLSKVFLSGMLNLKSLWLTGNVFSEVSLSDMPSLESLSFGGSTISKLSLSGLTNLTELSTTRAFSGSTISKLSLSGLTNLIGLGLWNRSLSEISLSNLPNLTDLDLSDNLISEISLSDLSNLTGLDLSDNLISEISLPPSLPNLERLFLENNALSEITLPSLPNLERLLLSNNALSEITLPSLPNLRYLKLENNALSEITLPSLPNLWLLFLSNNTLSEITLPSLPNLELLSLDNNALSEISLPSLPNLTELGLANNTISEVPLLDLPKLEELWLFTNAISEVSLSDMPNLKRLNLQGNPLSKVSLSNMPNLEYLSCPNNAIISEVSLSDIPNLESLYFGGSTISKLSLSGITNLTELNLGYHSISEVSLSDMPNLTKLYLYHNAISDGSGLSDLKNLEFLDLSNNVISDVSPLIAFPNLTELYLPNNPLNFASRRTYIPAMQARGVFVWFDERVSPILVKISGENQIGAPDLALPTPFVVQALDVEDKPMADVPIKFAVAQGRGKLSTTTATTDATGKAQTTLTLGPNPGTNTVAVIAEEFEKAVSFTATAVLDTVTPLRIAEDVNGDGVVNIQDLVLVSSNLGQVGENKADVNGDGVVNIQDLVKVSAALQ